MHINIKNAILAIGEKIILPLILQYIKRSARELDFCYDKNVYIFVQDLQLFLNVLIKNKYISALLLKLRS